MTARMQQDIFLNRFFKIKIKIIFMYGLEIAVDKAHHVDVF